MEVAEGKKILTDYMELDIIEIPKIYELKNTSKENKLLEWLYFLENPNSERVKNIMEENEGIQEATVKMEKKMKEEKTKMVKKMKEKNIEINTIAELTGLTVEQVKAIE